MRKIILGIVVVLAIGGAATGGWYYWTIARFYESTDNAYVQSDVSVISPKVAGYIRDLKVTDNQLVKRGDVLATIDDTDYAARVAQAETAVAVQRATIASIETQIRAQSSAIDQTLATVASDSAELRRTALDHDRYAGLAGSAWASRQRLEQAEADWRKAGASVTRSKAAVTAARDQVTVLEAQRAQAEAVVKQLETAVALARIDLENTVIRAPVDGVVGNKGVQLGQYVKAGTQLLFVVPLPSVYVVANFKETQLDHMRPGQDADVTVDAYPGRVLHGKIESFAPGSGAEFSLLPPENATGNFTKIVQRVPVRIALPSDGPLSGYLRPGLSVIVSVDTRGEGGRSGGLVGGAQAATAAGAPGAPVFGAVPRAKTP